MKKVTFAFIGMGGRGTKYSKIQFKYPDEMEIVAIADTRRCRLDAANEYLHLPEERLFDGADALLAQPKLADVLVIATQDAQHREHALKALEKGYDILLEKPIACTIEDCHEISEAAKKYGRRVIICHVLRYTPFYREIKRLIDEGAIGKVESIQATEQVGYYHYAHSFVRGNWHKMETSSPMILAKSCHDMDILLWLTGKKCLKVSSFGSLDYFKAENCPPCAPERCMDGCELDCPFHAEKFYLSRIPEWPANILNPKPTEENIREALRTTDYGKCVFKMDNDVVDHQVVNMLLEGGATVSFTMCGFTELQKRNIFIMGTEGEIIGDMKDRKIKVTRFNKPPVEIDLNAICSDFTGHGGGDSGMIYDVIRLFRGDDFDTSAITSIERSVESHYVAFAAEHSRIHEGEAVDMDQFIKKLN